MPDSNSTKSSRLDQKNRKVVWPIIVLIVLAALLIFIGIPGYFASQPSFYKGYTGFKTWHEAWRASTHNKMVCIDCHTKPELLDETLFRVRLIKEFYARFVLRPDKPTIFSKPSRAACFKCHTLNKTVTTSLGLRIPHKTHLTNKKVKVTNCLDCHSGLVHKKRPAKRNWIQPRMVTCLQSKCHNGKQAPKDCRTCHPPDFDLKPGYHRAAGFVTSAIGKVRSIHVRRYKNNKEYCHMCHERAFCDDCHGTDMPHPNKKKIWVKGQKKHVVTSREKPELCKKCHKQTDFCTNCHHDHDPAKGPWFSAKRGESIHPSVVREKGAPYCFKNCHDSTFCADPCHLKP